ncbi:hypothetical protein QY696_14675 [Xanthomonas campestris]|nr:hypothetical protein [Xanthomonas campestris]MEA9732075.1 hypothetical protein [Xanthomonas campestris]
MTEEIEAQMKTAGYVFEPPGHVSVVRLRDVLAALSDNDLAVWPGEVAKEEFERRRHTRP